MPLTRASSCAASRAARSNRNARALRNARISSASRLSKTLCHSRSGQSGRASSRTASRIPCGGRSVNSLRGSLSEFPAGVAQCHFTIVKVFLQFLDSAAARGVQTSRLCRPSEPFYESGGAIVALQINDARKRRRSIRRAGRRRGPIFALCPSRIPDRVLFVQLPRGPTRR
jgi:hypothetical protein